MVPAWSPKEVANYIMDRHVPTSPILARMVIDQQLDGRALAAFAADSDTEDNLNTVRSAYISSLSRRLCLMTGHAVF